MAEYTKGPWHANESQDGIWYVSTEVNGCGDIATVWGLCRRMPSDANARLIAAAPDLLEALERAQRTIEREFPHGQLAIDIRAALHLAKHGAATSQKETA